MEPHQEVQVRCSQHLRVPCLSWADARKALDHIIGALKLRNNQFASLTPDISQLVVSCWTAGSGPCSQLAVASKESDPRFYKFAAETKPVCKAWWSLFFMNI